jgi:hypothetical protein
MAVNVDVILRLIDKLTAPAKQAKAAVDGIKKATGQAAQTARQGAQAAARAATATRALTRVQFAFGRAIMTTRQRLQSYLPQFEAAGARIGEGLRRVALGMRDTVATSAMMVRRSAAIGLHAARRAVLASGLSAAGIVALTKSYAKGVATQAKFAKQTNISIRTLHELGMVAEAQDIPVATFERSIEELQKRIGQLKMGKGPLAKLYQQINPRLYRTLRRERDPEQTLEMILRDIARVKDVNRRALLARTAFGESGDEMVRMAMLTPEQRRAEREAARRRRPAPTDDEVTHALALDRAFRNLTEAVGGLRDRIGAFLAPVLTPLIRQLEEWLIVNRDLIATGASEFVAELGRQIKEIDFKGIVADVRDTVRRINDLVTSTIGWRAAIIGVLSLPLLPAISGLAIGLGMIVIGLTNILYLFKAALVAGLATFGPSILAAVKVVHGAILATVGKIGAGILALVGGWPVLIAVAIGTGLILAIRNWSSIKEWLGGLFDALPEGVQAALKAAGEAFSASALGKLTINVVTWIADLVDGIFQAIDGNADKLKDVLLRPWNALKSLIEGLIASVRSLFSFEPPGWFKWLRDKVSLGAPGEAPGSSPGQPAPTGSLDQPQMLGDVVNEIDNSRQVENKVNVTNHVTVNATTAATPQSIAATVAGSVTRGTRRAIAGLHDGGFAGSTFQGAP